MAVRQQPCPGMRCRCWGRCKGVKSWCKHQCPLVNLVTLGLIVPFEIEERNKNNFYGAVRTIAYLHSTERSLAMGSNVRTCALIVFMNP